MWCPTALAPLTHEWQSISWVSACGCFVCLLRYLYFVHATVSLPALLLATSGKLAQHPRLVGGVWVPARRPPVPNGCQPSVALPPSFFPLLPGLAASYGDRAADVTHIAEQRKLGKRIVRGYPILEAEVIYAGGQPGGRAWQL